MPMHGISDTHRIWWCPTGPLASLPIHAAGIYPSGPKLSDFVVSSYTPTITALLDAHNMQSCRLSQLLTVSLPKEAQLSETETEIASIKYIVQKTPGIQVEDLSEEFATPQSVSEAIPRSEWAHFACHGEQDNKDPTKSCLKLTNHSHLKLSDIIKLNLKNVQLAFLSACETAAGDKKLDDEAVHLAAGMLLAGYRGVIATTESVEDKCAANVAAETYRLLFEKYGVDPTRAAEALHFAIQSVQRANEQAGRVSFSWVPFIHMGI
jgi:CHAT domain-containing protein